MTSPDKSWEVPAFRDATAGFSCSLFLIRQNKSPCSEDTQIIFLNFYISSNQKIKIPRSSFQTTTHYSNVLILYYFFQKDEWAKPVNILTK